MSKKIDKITVRVTEETRLGFERLAELDRRTLSNYVNIVLEDYLKSLETPPEKDSGNK